MEFFELFSLSVKSCSLIITVSLTGFFCAWKGIITPTVQAGLCKLTVQVLLPCLLFAQVTVCIDKESLIRLWPLPTFLSIFSIISSILGAIGGKALGLPKSQTKFVMTGIIFNNVTSLPIGLIQSLVSAEAIKFLTWGDNDTPQEAASRGISYALLNVLLANILRFSLGTWLLKEDSQPNADLYSGFDEERRNSHSSTSLLNIQSPFKGTSENTPLIGQPLEISQRSENSKKWILTTVESIKNFMNPPLYAAFFAILVGGIPSLKNLFFGKEALFYSTITRSIEYIGNTTVPVTLFVLGAQLKNLAPGKNRELLPAISYILFCRYLIMPIFGIFLVIMTQNYFIDDPMLWFILIMAAGGPCAIDLMNMANVTNNFQEETATLLFYSYVILSPILTVYMMTILTIIDKLRSN